MNVNVHDILSFAADVVLGRKEGTYREKGWTAGSWEEDGRVCLGAALRVAETKLVGSDYNSYERDLSYTPARDAERVLADAVIQRYGTVLAGQFGGTRLEDVSARDVIIQFNDNLGTEDNIGEVLELADKMVWEAELEEQLARYTAGEVVSDSFLTYITQK